MRAGTLALQARRKPCIQETACIQPAYPVRSEGFCRRLMTSTALSLRAACLMRPSESQMNCCQAELFRGLGGQIDRMDMGDILEQVVKRPAEHC